MDEATLTNALRTLESVGDKLAALIYLRWADFQEAEQEAIAAFDDSPYEPALPARLHWRSYHHSPPDQLQEMLLRELLPSLERLGNKFHNPLATHLHRIAPAVAALAELPASGLRSLIDWVSEQPFETPDDRRQLLDRLDSVLHKCRDRRSGQFFTPPAAVQLMVELAAPEAGERIYDPCFGSAGLLTAALDYVQRHNGKRKTRGGETLLHVSGVEIDSHSYTVGLTRLALAGVADPQIELGNSLERAASNNPQTEGFDIVIANPPWGGKVDLFGLDHFPIKTNDSAALFVQHALMQLRPGGRAVVIVPPSILSSERTFKLRQMLLEEHAVEAVIGLSPGVVNPTETIRPSILLLRRGRSSRIVRMVDASFLQTGPRKRGPEVAKAIPQICDLVRASNPTEYAWDIDISQLESVSFDLTPVRRHESNLDQILHSLSSEVAIEKLGEVCTINSGRLVRAADLQDTPPCRIGPMRRSASWRTRSMSNALSTSGGTCRSISVRRNFVLPISRLKQSAYSCAQALQWAASSPQAGLGYLVRQGLRAGWTLDVEPLSACLEALRPYRSGPRNEPIDRLYQRMLKEIRQQDNDSDLDDLEEVFSGEDLQSGLPDPALQELLRKGLQLVTERADEKWRLIMDRILTPAGKEKVVLFAQPIETVTALADFLQLHTGETPALIIGGQSDAERDAQVERFRQPEGPRFLVSSRAGGEGINLQVARHLVHIDVPWNPMDMEQRVGRIHRFGSRRNVVIDTVVVKDSREADAYRIAREKLQLIASMLVEPERFESIFSRVMCLLPPEGLQDVLIQQALGPFTPHDQETIAQMVRQGYVKWRDFDEKFSQQQKLISQQDPGLAKWEDVALFLRDFAKAEPVKGFFTEAFELKEGDVLPLESPAAVVRLSDGQFYACCDVGGMPVFGPENQIAQPFGINLELVQELMRRLAFPDRAAGACHVRWPANIAVPVAARLFGVMWFLRQTVKTDLKAGWSEVGSSLRCYVISEEQPATELTHGEKRSIFDGLTRATVRAKPALADHLVQQMADAELELTSELRRPSPEELGQGIRHAVMPLLAAVVEVGGSRSPTESKEEETRELLDE